MLCFSHQFPFELPMPLEKLVACSTMSLAEPDEACSSLFQWTMKETILEAGRKQFAMAPDLLEYPWVVRPPVIFASTDELVNLVPSRIIAPAEEKHQARQQLLDELFG
jgi:hypothetical protein